MMNKIIRLFFIAVAISFCGTATAAQYTLDGDFIKGVSFVKGVQTWSVNALYIDNNADILYCGAGPVIYTIDVSKPLQPKVMSSTKVYGLVRQIAVQDGILYATCREAGVFILDVKDPRNINLICRYDPVELATGVEISGSVLFLGTRMNGVECVDVTDPANPVHICMRRTGESQSVTYLDGYLYSGEWGTHEITVFDSHDMSDFRILRTVPIQGFGDGVWTYKDRLYVATGHNLCKPGLTYDEAYGLGHGLEVFDISKRDNPKFISRIGFEKMFWRNNDWWTPRPMSDGRYVAVADAANGLYIVDCRKPKSMTVAGCINFTRKNGTPVATTSVAVGKGVIYASVYNDNGLAVLECPKAFPAESAKGVPPVNASWRDPYETSPKSHFTAWKPDKYSPVRGVAAWGDYMFAACSYGGMSVLRMNPDGTFGKVADGPRPYVGDVKVRGNRLYAAEGYDGLAVYEIGENAALMEIARWNGFSEDGTRPVCQWVFVPDDTHIVASIKAWGYHILDASDLGNIKVLKKYGTEVPGWDKYVSDRADADGWYPRMSHAHSIRWVNMKTNDFNEVINQNMKPKLYDGVCACRDGFAVASRGSLYLFDSKDREAEYEGVEGDFYGMPCWDGADRLGLTYRCFKQIRMVSIEPGKAPRVLWKEDTCGYPETSTFWNGKLAVPCGYQGLLIEK